MNLSIESLQEEIQERDQMIEALKQKSSNYFLLSPYREFIESLPSWSQTPRPNLNTILSCLEFSHCIGFLIEEIQIRDQMIAKMEHDTWLLSETLLESDEESETYGNKIARLEQTIQELLITITRLRSGYIS